MKKILIVILCIVPGVALAQQKPSNVLIWCQSASGTTSAPCQAGNSLDYDSGGGTVNQGTVGIVLPASGGPVAGGTSTNPIRTDPTGTTPQPVTQSGTWTLSANQSVNAAQINGVTPLMGAGNTGTGSPRVTEATDSQLSTGVGATGDAAATVGSAGSLNAKGRLMTSQLDAIQTAVQLIDNIVSGSGANISQINGATAQVASNGLNTTGAGLQANALAGQCDDTTPATLTENQFGHWRINCSTHHGLIEIAAALPAGSNVIGALTANQSVNVSQINGVTPLMGAGNTGTGSPRVTIATDQAALNGLGVYVEDAAETAGGNLSMAGSVRRDTAASSAGASGDNATLNTDASGLLWTRTIDACSSGAKTFLPINISTATTTEITPSLAGASTNYYICSLVLVTAAANNIALVDDDTDNCASVTSGLAGGTTAGSGFNMAANSGMTFGNGMGSVFKTNGANRVVCIVTSAATQLSGTMSVVAAP